MKISKGVLGTLLVVGAVLVAGVAYAQSTSRSGDSIVGRVDYVEMTHPYGQQTACADAGGAFDTMVGMTKSFSQGGLFSNEITVNFSSNVINGSGEIALRLLVDGVVHGNEVILYDGNNLGVVPMSYNFVSDSLSPGNHTVEIEWRASSGSASCIDNSSMVIHHR